MRIAKQKQYRARTANRHFVIFDEAHLLLGIGGSAASLSTTAMQMRTFAVPRRRMIATQAVMKFNSGKRVRFLGSTRWEDTGESIKATPKKFVPAQVVRRARESALDELAAEGQKLGMYN
jgi:hypothetical protein